MSRSFACRLLVVGQCALVAIAAVHGMPALRGATPTDIYTSDLGFLQLVVLCGLFAVYAWGARFDVAPRTIAYVIAGTTVLAVLQLPTTSRDVYSYITLGRTAAVYGLGPYVALYPAVAGDPWASFVWFRGPSHYGPATLLLFVPAAWLSTLHPVLALAFLKLAGAAAFVICCWCVWRLAGALGRDARRALYLFGCNPLLLHELVANAHNDGWALAAALASLVLVTAQRARLAALLALVAPLVKLSFLATAVASASLFVRQRRWRALALLAGGAIAAAIVMYVAFAPAASDLLQLTDPAAAGRENSVFHWLEVIARDTRLVSPATALVLATRLAMIAMIAFAVFAAWRFAKVRDVDDVIAELALLLLVLLLCGPRLWPWYVTWLLPFAALTRSAQVRATALVLSASCLGLYVPVAYPRLHDVGLLCALALPVVDWLVRRRA